MSTVREPAIDVLRGVAIVGVVAGHWLATALTAPDPVDGVVRSASPLGTLPALVPVSWLFQTLGVFFLVAGFGAARSLTGLTRSPLEWWWARVVRVTGPVGTLFVVVATGATALVLAGAPQDLVTHLPWLALSPLWFLGVYLTLLAASPFLVRLDARWGVLGATLPAGLALAASWWGGITAVTTVVTAWWVPWQLGIAMARRPLSTTASLVLLLAGCSGLLVALAAHGLPLTAVGVPGHTRSNLNPPSVATVALVVAQAGAVGLVRAWPTRWWLGRVVGLLAVVSRSALPIFLFHQPVLVAVWLGTLPLGPIRGLHDSPENGSWVIWRLAWFPILVGLLALAVAAMNAGRRHRARALDGRLQCWCSPVPTTARSAAGSRSGMTIRRQRSTAS